MNEERPRDTRPEAITGEMSASSIRRLDDVERRVDRLYREHFGEGDYDGTRERISELRNAFESFRKEYHEDKNDDRRERQGEHDTRNRAMDMLSNAVKEAVAKIESRRPSIVYLVLAVIATLAVVWMAIPKG